MESQDTAPKWPPDGCSEIGVWLNARADGECTPAQEGWLAEHIQECRGCSLEWAAVERTRLAMENARLKEPTDFELEALARAMGPRFLFAAGWGLLLVGGIVLAGVGGWELFTESDMPVMARLGIGAFGLGAALLLGRVAWERLRVYRHDPYRGVRR